MKTISRYIMTLALLLTAVTGAWAEEEVLLTTVTATGQTTYSQSPDGIVTVTLDNISSYNSPWGWTSIGSVTVEAAQGYTITRCVFRQNPNNYPNRVLVDDLAPFTATMVPNIDGGTDVTAATSTGDVIGGNFMNGISSIEVYGYLAEPPIEVTPGEVANTWTFAMPGSDVVLTPIYAKAAAFATTGTGSEAKTLLPAAAEGVIAGTDAPLIAEGTGIVANITGTETAQGTLMYAISTSATEAPAPDDFSPTVPTAESYDDAATVYVWYYIQGANAPQGEAATLDNTFDDTEPACLTVQVLTNKFDITLNAANANTIEAGKATVTIKTGDAEAVDKTADIDAEHKLKGVKMGSEVKLKAATGYKFRKVEVKKAASTPTLKDALKDGATVVITYTWWGTNVTTFTYTNNGGNYTGSTTGDNAEYFSNGMSMSGTDLLFWASNLDIPEANVSIDFDTDTNEYLANKGSVFTSFTISVNGTDVTSQLKEVK